MSEGIGKKIKYLRKELKMTQSELAEPEMTKSMLSHIENGTANPSMKNLQYIATKLNKPISYFLEEESVIGIEVNTEEKTLSMENVLDSLEEIDSMIKLKEFKQSKDKLNKILNSYKFNEKGKLYADILFRMANCHIRLKEFHEGESYLNKCLSIYIDNTLFVEAARTKLLFLKKLFQNHDYKNSIIVLEDAYDLYSKSSSRDVFLEIEMLANEPLITIAQGDFDKTINLCERAIELSNENNIYYLTDLLYRNKAIAYLLQGEYKKFLISMDKAKKYVEFTSNKYILARIFQNYAMYENMVNNPVKALECLKVYEENTEERAFYYYLEVARAYYLLGDYEKAMKNIEKVNYEEEIFYMIDCIYILNSLVLKGLIYSKYKEFDKAVQCISEAIKGIEKYTTVEYEGFVKYSYKELSLAYEALSEVYSQNNNYELAFVNLKKSNELRAKWNL